MSKLLDGVKVLDFSRYIAGPYCAQLFSDMGAEVIKVEKAGIGDETRILGPWVNGKSIYFAGYNRDKKSVAVNLRNPDAIAAIRKLADTADIIIENFRPGVMAKMGLGYEELKKTNPGIIMISVSGFGQTGPYKDRAAVDTIMASIGGLMKIDPELTPLKPVKPNGAVCDTMSAMYGAIGGLAAYTKRLKTGVGDHVDVAMLASVVSPALIDVADYVMNGTEYYAPDSAPQGSAKAKDGWVAYHAGTTSMWARMKELVSPEEYPILFDPKYDDVAVRVEERHIIMDEIQRWMSNKTCDEVEEIFNNAGIPVGIFGTWERLHNNPQLNARHDYIDVDVEGVGKVPYLSLPIKFDSFKVEDTDHCSYALGAHNKEILGSLGFSDEEIESFEK